MADSHAAENPIVTGDLRALLAEGVVPAQLLALWGGLAALLSGVHFVLDLADTVLGHLLSVAELFLLALGAAHVLLYVLARAIYLAEDAA